MILIVERLKKQGVDSPGDSDFVLMQGSGASGSSSSSGVDTYAVEMLLLICKSGSNGKRKRNAADSDDDDDDVNDGNDFLELPQRRKSVSKQASKLLCVVLFTFSLLNFHRVRAPTH